MHGVGRVWERTLPSRRGSPFGTKLVLGSLGSGAAKHVHEFFWTWALSLYFGVFEALVAVELCVLGVCLHTSLSRFLSLFRLYFISSRLALQLFLFQVPVNVPLPLRVHASATSAFPCVCTCVSPAQTLGYKVLEPIPPSLLPLDLSRYANPDEGPGRVSRASASTAQRHRGWCPWTCAGLRSRV